MCNVSIRVEPHGRKIRVNIQKHCLIIDGKIFTFSGIVFDPMSTSGLKSTGNWIEFNLQILDTQPVAPVKWKLEAPVEENTPIRLTCHCGYFLNNVVFQRVLALPSAGWDASHAFCHAEKDESLETFRKTDCLFGTHFIHVNSDLKLTDTCPKCLTLIGETRRQGFSKLWLANVQLNSVCDLHGQFLAILFDIVLDPVQILPKILLQSGDLFVAIRVLEKNLKVFQWDASCCGNLKARTVLKVEYFYEGKEINEWQTDCHRVHDFQVPPRLLDYTRKLLNDSHANLHPSFNKTADFNLAYVSVG